MIQAVFFKIVESASFFGNFLPLAVLGSASMFLYLLSLGKLKEAAIFILANISFLYSVGLKYIFKTPRPQDYAVSKSKFGDIYAFPSSHVVFYICFWGFLLYLTFKKDIFGDVSSLIVRVLAVYHILFIGISRIYLGAHTLMEVVAGYAFGLLYLLLLIFLSR